MVDEEEDAAGVGVDAVRLEVEVEVVGVVALLLVEEGVVESLAPSPDKRPGIEAMPPVEDKLSPRAEPVAEASLSNRS